MFFTIRSRATAATLSTSTTTRNVNSIVRCFSGNATEATFDLTGSFDVSINVGPMPDIYLFKANFNFTGNVDIQIGRRA